MTFQIARHQTEKYQILTDVYQGPLDLLLYLIERAELDITTIALASVTDQYLTYLHDLEDQSPAEVSAFLVIASRLVQIKSAALLPRPQTIEKTTAEEDPGEALARQLIIYRRFKQLGQWLADRDSAGMRTYLRVAPPPVHAEAKLDMTGYTLNDLVQTARQVFSKDFQLAELSKVVSLPRMTVRDKIRTILHYLRENQKTRFNALLTGRSRVEIVVAFLAILELIKRHIISADQPDTFGEIEIQAEGEIDETIETESEFGE